tara:strand:+ start:815 stop:1672 length:858 start_codon:yes stop_codon:yes gene_type:complete
MKKILKKLYIKYLNWKNNRLYNKKYEVKSILGKKYTITKGCIRNVSDYDDAWLLFLSSKAEIVFDVGCNIGQSSLLITHSNSLKKLILIEPNPLSLSMAAENLIINNKSENIIFIPKAAYNKSKINIKLWSMQGAFAGASLDVSYTDTGKITKNYFDVETITLDEIAETYSYFPDLVKIDVEGTEFSVLEGSINIAKKENTIFIVEIHSSIELNIVENTNKILQWADQNNYNAYYLCEHKKLINSEYIKQRGRYHMLLIHKQKKYPDGLNRIKQGLNIEQLDFIN